MNEHARLFERYRTPVRHYLSRFSGVPAVDIDDLTQEAFMRLLRYTDTTTITNPAGYLFRIAANVANEWRVLSRVSKPHDDEWLQTLLIDESKQPEEIFERECRDAYVRSRVDELPSRQRQVLLMHIQDGLTYNQIAKELGITYRVVLRDLTRAYSALRFKLNDL